MAGGATGDPNYTRRITSLEEEVRVLRHRAGDGKTRMARDVSERDTYLAITTAENGYPNERDPRRWFGYHPKFPFHFVDCEFDESYGWEQTKTNKRTDLQGPPPNAAVNITGTWLPPGTLVKVTWHRTLGPENSGEYYIERVLEYEVIMFELTGPLLLDTAANAVTVIYSQGQYVTTTETIIVTNYAYQPGMFSGEPGWRGIAVQARGGAGRKSSGQDTGRPIYEIIWMEHKAEMIRVLLLGKLHGQGQVVCLTLDWWDGKSPGPFPTCFDKHKHWPYAQAGALGYARWNNRASQPYGNYELIEVQQMSFLLDCKASSKACPDDQTVGVASFKPMVFSTFNQTPDKCYSARNRYNLACEPGDDILVAWDETLKDWIWIQADHKEVRVAVGMRFKGTSEIEDADCELQLAHRKIAVMYCDEKVTWGCEPDEKIPMCVPMYEHVVIANVTKGQLCNEGGGEDDETGEDPDTCGLQLYADAFCAFDQQEADPPIAATIEFTEEVLMWNVFHTPGDGIYGCFKRVWVMCPACDDWCVPIIPTIDCDSSSEGEGGEEE